jgi:hypothetical protein
MAEVHAAGMVVAFGAYATATFGRALYLGAASRHWPRTTGTIRETDVVVVNVGSGRGPINLEGGAYVIYRYAVRGHVHHGNRLRFGPSWWW